MEARQSAVYHVLNKTGRVECFRKVTHTQKKIVCNLGLCNVHFVGSKKSRREWDNSHFKKEPKPYLSLCDWHNLVCQWICGVTHQLASITIISPRFRSDHLWPLITFPIRTRSGSTGFFAVCGVNSVFVALIEGTQWISQTSCQWITVLSCHWKTPCHSISHFYIILLWLQHIWNYLSALGRTSSWATV